MISKEILDKYRMLSLEELKAEFGDSAETEIWFYREFLNQTDHIPNKISERFVKGLSETTLSNFIGVYIGIVKDIKNEYKDILDCRQFARDEINRLLNIGGEADGNSTE